MVVAWRTASVFFLLGELNETFSCFFATSPMQSL
jgi:hypothetical protein